MRIRRFGVVPLALAVSLATLLVSPGDSAVQAASPPQVGGCSIFPADNVWNTRVDGLPTDSNSLAYVNSIGASTGLHPDFGADPTYGIPYVVVPRGQPRVS